MDQDQIQGFLMAAHVVQQSAVFGVQIVPLESHFPVGLQEGKAILNAVIQFAVQLVQLQQHPGVGFIQHVGPLHAPLGLFGIVSLVVIGQAQVAPHRGKIAVDLR